jgi:4-hydroxybenzoate polyprenyltransferase
MDKNTIQQEKNLSGVCYRLLRDTAKDRLMRLEANTIAGNFLLLIAFHFSVFDFIVRMAVTLYINLLGYFINDYIDVEVDLASEQKDKAKALYIKNHKKAALGLIVWMSAILLTVTLLYSKSVCFGVIMLLLIVTIYTDYYKNRPYWDVIFIGLWGFALSWIAIPDFSWEGIRYIVLLFLFGCAFETVQTLKDYEEDKICTPYGWNPVFIRNCFSTAA